MFKLSALSSSDITILMLVMAMFASVLGLLADIIMRDKGFGPLRNALIILAGGMGGMFLRADYFPVAQQALLFASMMAAIAAATLALLLACLLKRLVQS